ISLHARDVTVHGVRLRYEPAEKKRCVGFWSDPEDWMSWKFDITRPGRFRVRMAQGCGKGHGGSVAEVTVGGLKEVFTVEDTGHFQNFKWREIGEVDLSEPGSHTLAVRALDKARAAVMDVREVQLVPVP
ncbi:MAG: N-acetylgalactosamine 6-sulfate sulfatase (GALNS), partial [Phycisphaerae bacterium]|nr:N-acetylgalactosamine 6-sulfate sulfatase (GALNS) [Phycisphaerae bacterium]